MIDRDVLVSQEFRLHSSIAEGAGSIPAWGTKISHAGTTVKNS